MIALEFFLMSLGGVLVPGTGAVFTVAIDPPRVRFRLRNGFSAAFASPGLKLALSQR